MKLKGALPNAITISRVLLIPLFLGILFSRSPHKETWAAGVFVILILSDFFDGYLARKKKEITTFGIIADPIADKLLAFAALIFLAAKNIPFWMAAAIIAREVVMTAVRFYLMRMKIILPANFLGKSKTFFQSIAIVAALLELPFHWHLMLLATLLTVISGIEYFWIIRQKTGTRIVNLPNMITLSRLLLIIPYFRYFSEGNMTAALMLFAVIAVSDKLDGLSARLMRQMTEVGSALDSFTDWTLNSLTLVLLVVNRGLSLAWLPAFALPIISSAILKMKYAKRSKHVPVTLIARIGVSMLYIALISIILNIGYTFYFLLISLLLQYVVTAAYAYKLNALGKR